ncbi:unnamed protein product [Adineta steineri]|uniref:Uncharacterized protein n=1 Tax=Adineta steineri TaxID=433720 RepID=A0A814RYX6_9BILA|nr:unnamed protein product [Adineta steineri]
MIDWLTIVIALVIIATLVGFFGFLAMKMNMSDPLSVDVNNQHLDTVNDKKKKDKNVVEQGKKKRKDQKKSKREIKDEEQQQQEQRTKGKGQTSEETDNEHEESEQELNRLPSENVETSSKARKRNKNKTSTNQTETNVTNEKNPTTTRAPPVTHPKVTLKDELESKKQQTKAQVKSSQVSNKQALPVATTTSTTNKKTTQSNRDEYQEESFTIVGGNRHKSGTPPAQQQQNKSQVNTAPTTAPVSLAPVQQASSTPIQHDHLAQRQQPQQKQTPVQASTPITNSVPVKQQQQHQTPKVQPKVADLIKSLPSSQLVVTELMSALDAFPLSTDELDIIMQKIANKQSVVKQDWSKLQYGQKVDPQAHIGQVMDESSKAYVDDMKTNSGKRLKELTDELNTEKRRNNDLVKEKAEKQREIQMLHAQLDSVQHKTDSTQAHQPQQQKLELQLKRLTEENLRLNQQLTQHLTTSNVTNTGDASNMKFQVLSEQMKKLSVDNANWEKKAHSNELLAKEAQKEKEDLIRYNEQLTQSLQTAEKELKSVEEKHHKQSKEGDTAYANELKETKRRLEQLQAENEQLRREDIVHVEPTSPTDIQTISVNNEEREKFEKEIHELKQTVESNKQKEREYENLKTKLTGEIEEFQKNIHNINSQHKSHENELRQEIERLQNEKNNVQQETDKSHNNELKTLKAELDKIKSTMSQSEEHLRQEHEKQRKILTDLLTEDVRSQLPHDNQNFDQWFSSYRQLFETNKNNAHQETEALKRENEQLHKNMTDIENHLKEIEQTVQNKEETLFTELKSKDVVLDSMRGENEQLKDEMVRLRNEIQRLQSIHDASSNEVRVLKHQLDERFLIAANSPQDESFELVKQPSPSLSPIVIDIRAEQLNELIRSSKEALENQESITQQLDKHLNDIHSTGQGETSNTNESTVLSSTDQQS